MAERAAQLGHAPVQNGQNEVEEEQVGQFRGAGTEDNSPPQPSASDESHQAEEEASHSLHQ